ncbi:MAG: exodeoxyribonuclease VII small subunit [Bacteroidales bacterium]|nr:exodeoxyribonuclease VII small subunit [Bacteroidales bacterium]
MEKFDYTKAIATLEEIALKVEDPSTGVEDIDKYISQTEELVEKCRAYLRTVREKVDTIDRK